MSNKGVSGFWLDIDKLESARTHIIGELGAKEGMLVYGVWVRLFTWQYQSAAPITGPEHIKNLTGLHRNKAELLWGLLPQLLPRSLIQSPHGLLCRKTMGVLSRHHAKSTACEIPKVSKMGGDSDSDSDSDLSYSSVLLSSEVKPPSESKPKVGGVGGAEPPPSASTLAGLNLKSWGEYEQHRKDNRKTKLKPKSVDRLQRWLVEQGDEDLQAAIVDQTIRNGWTGLFELKPGNNAKPAADPDFQRWLNGEDSAPGKTYEGEYEKH